MGRPVASRTLTVDVASGDRTSGTERTGWSRVCGLTTLTGATP
jgi:hypothetical protein